MDFKRIKSNQWSCFEGILKCKYILEWAVVIHHWLTSRRKPCELIVISACCSKLLQDVNRLAATCELLVVYRSCLLRSINANICSSLHINELFQFHFRFLVLPYRCIASDHQIQFTVDKFPDNDMHFLNIQILQNELSIPLSSENQAILVNTWLLQFNM